MIQTIVVDIINENALRLLRDLELLHLIKIHKKENLQKEPKASLKGRMSKQSLTEIDSQLNELRNGWE
jgi:hypothetical protein